MFINTLIEVLKERRIIMEDEIKLGKYRHFKGGEYEVLCLAKHSETEEKMVVYRALYGNGDVWVRPLRMWNEIVEYEGRRVHRFEHIDR